MKKLTFCLSILLVLVWNGNAQTLPAKIKSYLDANYKNGTWKPVPGACNPKTSVLTGDFDGDGQKDYLVRFKTGKTAKSSRLFLIAFFNQRGKYTPEPFYEVAYTDDFLRSGSAVIKKGTSVSLGLGAEGEGPKITLKTDAIAQYICQTDASKTFVYQNGAMKDIQELGVEKTSAIVAKPTPTSVQNNAPPNLSGKWIYKGRDGSDSKDNPWQITQNGDKLRFEVNGASKVNGVDLTGRIKADSFIIDVKGSGTIEQSGNIIQFRDGDYMVKEGYTGELGKGSGIPKIEQECINLAQGKVAWNRAGETNWNRLQLYILCMATDNPEATLDCFKAELKKQDDVDKNSKTCSAMLKIIDQTLNPNSAETMPRQTLPTGEKMIEEILTVHNKYRAEVGVEPLKWSKALAISAQNWANQLAKKKRLEHSKGAENIYMAGSRLFSYTQIVDAWGSEKQFFVPGKFPNISKTKKWADVGHYTQMIWRKTTEVGCGIASDGTFDYVVCHYNPPGNVPGQPVF